MENMENSGDYNVTLKKNIILQTNETKQEMPSTSIEEHFLFQNLMQYTFFEN